MGSLEFNINILLFVICVSAMLFLVGLMLMAIKSGRATKWLFNILVGSMVLGIVCYFVYLFKVIIKGGERLIVEGKTTTEAIIYTLEQGSTYTELATFATLLGLLALFLQNRNALQQPENQEYPELQQTIVALKDEIQQLRESISIKEDPSIEIGKKNIDKPLLDSNSKINSTPNLIVGLLTVSLLTLILNKKEK